MPGWPRKMKIYLGIILTDGVFNTEKRPLNKKKTRASKIQCESESLPLIAFES